MKAFRDLSTVQKGFFESFFYTECEESESLRPLFLLNSSENCYFTICRTNLFNMVKSSRVTIEIVWGKF